MPFCVAAVALCDIPTSLITRRKLKLEEVSHEMIAFLRPRVSSRVSGFPVASPCLWGKLQSLSFSKVSKQVVMSFCVAGVALCNIPTSFIPFRNFFCVAGATMHSTLYTLHFTLHTLPSALYAPHSTLYTPHSTLHTPPHSTLHTLHTPHSTLALHTPHFTLHTPHSRLSTPHSTLYIPHFALCTPQFTLHTLRFTLHTLHSTL